MSDAYDDGIEAGYRINKYKNIKDPKNPYPENSREAEDWNEGFADGSEDYWKLQEI